MKLFNYKHQNLIYGGVLLIFLFGGFLAWSVFFNESIESSRVAASRANAADTALKAGGLTEYPSYQLGGNALTNEGFEVLNNNVPAGWVGSSAFSADTAVGHSGTHSYRLKDAPNFPYTESASQTIAVKKGMYRVSGWIKTDLGTTANKGVRFAIRPEYSQTNIASTTTFNGVNDWQYFEKTNIVITQDTNVSFRIEAYNEPEGTAWFDDVALQEELGLPLDIFMKYPNYRGMLFDDQSQTMQFDITVNPPSGTALADYIIQSSITDEATKEIVSQKTFSNPENNFTASLEGNGLEINKTYLVSFALQRVSDNTEVYNFPSYRISKISGSARDSMTMAFDENNRILVRDVPTFILGAYDSGMGYSAAEATWKNSLFGTQRRLFELPINFYINYWYGQASSAAMKVMMNVLQERDILYFQTGNCFGATYNPTQFSINTDDAYLSTLSSHAGLGGFYTIDECNSDLAPQMFSQYQRLKNFDPDGATFAALNQPDNLFYWRDSSDFLSTDPYPLYGAEPPAGYSLNMVSDWTKSARETVKASRPIMTVIQFFKFTSLGRWPTQSELRNMSYMAIAEGSNGLVYWSLGAGALAYVCDDKTPETMKDVNGWCPVREDYFSRLKAVMNELKNIEPALASVDRNDLLTQTNNTSIKIRVKFADGKAYLIASNITNSAQDATFTWSQNPTFVSVYNESRNIIPDANVFRDSFSPYEAHVYIISTEPIEAPPLKSSDLNKDGKVDQIDFDILKSDFGKTDTPVSDINKDGIVDSKDLGILMSEWNR